MKNHVWRNTIIVLLVVFALFAISVLFGAFRSSSVAADTNQALSAETMQRLIPRGRELALAGDCFGCHSNAQGPQAAGGVPIPTPFGTLYSTNITPDPTYGIGNYTRADFHRVLRDGIAPGNRNLYPAMPYVFTQITTPDDLDALYAYMMSIEPIAQPNKANTGVYEFPVRPFMNFWTLLNFPQRTVPEDPSRSAQWLRGAYLVRGLGHCGACHTPRNVTMGVEFSRDLQGGEVDGLKVPDITAAALSAHGFDQATLGQYLKTGISPQGTSFGGMHTVTHFSTSNMDPNDVDAIATYLLTGSDGKIMPPAAPPAPLPQAAAVDAAAASASAAASSAVDAAPAATHSATPLATPSAAPSPGSDLAAGRLIYMSACAGCHGAKGEGIPNVAPAMKGNATLAMSDPLNTLTVILNGIPTQTFPGGQRMYAMPPFAHVLSEEEIAELTDWIRAEWGGQGGPVSVEQVRAIAGPVK